MQQSTIHFALFPARQTEASTLTPRDLEDPYSHPRDHDEQKPLLPSNLQQMVLPRINKPQVRLLYLPDLPQRPGQALAPARQLWHLASQTNP